MLRAQKNQTVPLLQLDRSSPTLEALVLNYWDILEREFWLMLGSSFAALEHTQEAELAYREVLKHEPQEWRAYNGLLLLYLEADATTFDPLLEEAQTVLQLKGWTDRLPFGFPVQFFDGRVLESKRLVK
jgi:hypothetical protein